MILPNYGRNPIVSRKRSVYGHQADLPPLTLVIWDSIFIYFHMNLGIFLSFQFYPIGLSVYWYHTILI